MLFLGGRRELLLAPRVAEAVGEGVEVDIMSSELGDCINRAEYQILGQLQSPPTCGKSLSRKGIAN